MEQSPGIFSTKIYLFTYGAEKPGYVVVSNHYTLGYARRAGSKNEVTQVVRADLNI